MATLDVVAELAAATFDSIFDAFIFLLLLIVESLSSIPISLYLVPPPHVRRTCAHSMMQPMDHNDATFRAHQNFNSEFVVNEHTITDGELITKWGALDGRWSLSVCLLLLLRRRSGIHSSPPFVITARLPSITG